jgi:DNA mismatch endonuclease, patch repair protein
MKLVVQNDTKDRLTKYIGVHPKNLDLRRGFNHTMNSSTVKKKSEMMGRVKSRDTGAEMQVRRLLHSLGYRYRLHGKDLPGRPDLVFLSRRKVIFVHGCFWHQHKGCSKAKRPKTNVQFWDDKLNRNIERDRENQKDLEKAGWDVFIAWECKITDIQGLERDLRAFLERRISAG